MPSGQELFFYHKPAVEVLIIQKFEIDVDAITKAKKYFVIKIDGHSDLTEESYDEMDYDDENTTIGTPYWFWKYDCAKYQPQQCKIEQIGNDYTPFTKKATLHFT